MTAHTYLDFVKMIDNNIGARPENWRDNLLMIAEAADAALNADQITHDERLQLHRALVRAAAALSPTTRRRF